MGSNETESSSRPLTADERAQTYDASKARLAQYIPSGTLNYSAATSPGVAKTLTGSDYDALEQSLYNSQLAGIDTAVKRKNEDINQSASDRGLWASGVPIANQHEFYADYVLPAYQKAAADAATQRFQLQSGENQMLNNYNMAGAQLATDKEKSAYETTWRPADYWQGVWNGTGGIISNSSGGGWSI